MNRWIVVAFLFCAISLAYVPFLQFRVLRMAGDEKVYVSQAIEMTRNGSWFVQTLAGVPNYFKGPLHYVLIRIGFLLFGETLFAGVYMNWLFALLSAFAMYGLTRKKWGDKSASLLGLAAALNVGVYTHCFASQMEVELCGIYSLAIYALGRNQSGNLLKRDLLFWVTAGIAGWIKSPLHSVLLGFSALAFWLTEGTLLERIKSPLAWLAAILGILTAAAGYLPAMLGDYQNFMGLFLGRENFDKPDNGRHFDYVIRSLPHFAFPWTFIVLAGLVRGLTSFRKLKDKRLFLLGLSVSVVNIFFFSIFRYKGQNYNLPTMSALLLLGWAAFDGKIPSWSNRTTATILAIALPILIALFIYFGKPAWWSWFLLMTCLSSLLLSSALFFVCRTERGAHLGAVCFFIFFGSLILPIGEYEMKGLKDFQKQHPELTLHYYDLENTIWSEWGLLELVLHKPVYGVHRENQIPESLSRGHAIIVPGEDALSLLKNVSEKFGISLNDFQVEPWPRWLTKGTTPSGESRWKQAWATRDLSLLSRDFYILYLGSTVE